MTRKNHIKEPTLCWLRKGEHVYSMLKKNKNKTKLYASSSIPDQISRHLIPSDLCRGESEINGSVLELYRGASHDQVMQFCLDIVRLWQKPESLFIKTPKCSRHLPSFPCSWPFSTCNENTRQECHISPRPGSSANVSSFKKRFIYNHKPKKEKECCQENNTEHPQGSCIYRNFCASTCNCEWLMTALLWFLTLVICF